MSHVVGKPGRVRTLPIQGRGAEIFGSARQSAPFDDGVVLGGNGLHLERCGAWTCSESSRARRPPVQGAPPTGAHTGSGVTSEVAKSLDLVDSKKLNSMATFVEWFRCKEGGRELELAETESLTIRDPRRFHNFKKHSEIPPPTRPIISAT